MPVDLDFDGHGDAALFRGVFQAGAESPRQVGIEIFELEALFLQSNLFEIAFNGHDFSRAETAQSDVVTLRVTGTQRSDA
jgi:hypothetical protein